MQSSRRVGASHKSGVQRGVLAVRASVQIALDALGEDAADVAKARETLEHAESALRLLELKLAAAASQRTGWLGTVEQDAVLEQQYECGNHDTAKWLVGTFTEQCADIAVSSSELQVCRAGSLRARRPRGAQEHGEDVHRALSTPAVVRIMEQCGGYAFDALDLAAALDGSDEPPLAVFGAHVLKYRGGLVDCVQRRGWIEDSETFSQAFLGFLSQIDSLYKPELSYHNAAHAVDVMATVDVFMRVQYVLDKSTSLDHVLALAAAAAHDVGHPGRNALFQTKTMSHLAIRYNDQSILENMHASLAFLTMQQHPDCNWLALLAKDSGGHQVPNLQQYARQCIISMILATDMAKHQKYVLKLAGMAEHAELGVEAARASESPTERQEGGNFRQGQEAFEEKLFVMDTMLHAADLSNPCKPREIALRWTRRVCEEFWLQGDEERRLGLVVSPMCDRTSGAASVPQGQLGFINFVVRPLYSPLAELAAEVREAKQQLDRNAAFWEEKAAEGASLTEIFGEVA